MTVATRISAVRSSTAARWLIFPVLVLGTMLVLVGLNLSGSSIGLLSTTTPTPGLVAGDLRPVRVDEFALQTPIAISSVRQGCVSSPWIGLNRIDQAATAHGGPTCDWTTVLKPQDWGYLVGASRGLAWSWWWSFAIGLIGCFALLGVITRRPLLSALLSAAAVFTPYAGWWTSPAPSLFLGYAAATAAFIMVAWTARSTRVAALAAVGCGASGIALVFALYPPWQISLAWVIVPLALGFALDRRIPWRRFLWPLGVAAVVAGAGVGAWFAQHHAAITAQADTYYPGQRVSPPGTASARAMLDGPLNFWLSGDAGGKFGSPTGNVSLANLSEAASSWLPLPVAALVMLGVVELLVRRVTASRSSGRHRDADSVTTPGTDDTAEPAEPAGTAEPATAPAEPAAVPLFTLIFVSLSALLLLAWALIDVPEFLGKITGLGRVTPSRTPLAIGFALLLLVAAASTVRREERPLAWRWPAAVVGVVATAAITIYVDRRLPWDDDLTPVLLVALSGAVLAAGFAGLLLRRTRIVAALVLAAYCFVSWAVVNPLQQGIGPITKDPLVRTLSAAAGRTDNPRVAVFADIRISGRLVSLVRGAGYQSITGVTPYPDRPLMTALAPTQEKLWNNYLQYTWKAVATGTPPSIVQVTGTQVMLLTPACDPRLLASVDPGWVVSDQSMTDAACLTPAAHITRRGYPELWIYRVGSGSR